MLVSLYTVRVVLEVLGAEDYGIYNVVAGVVVMFSFLNTAMTESTQRFLNFFIGQSDIEQVRNIYSISFMIHILIAVLVIILAETIGLWFFYTWLNISLERQGVAFIVYQFSVALTVINILLVPYRAVIIAYEKMYFFALSSIIEALLKLVVVFLLTIILLDKLIVYAFLVFIVGIITFLFHKVYCNRMFETAHFRYCNDKKLFGELVTFSGWNVFSRVAIVSSSQGINILINIFYGVIVNAAMGIATQVNTAIYTFVSNFQTAFRPQIIKSYAAKDYDYFIRLIFQTSKISLYLLLFFVLPLYVNADFVLYLWLKNVPDYTVVFTRLMLINSLEVALGGPFVASMQAIGDIKKYQIIISCFIFANLPLSLLFLFFGFSPVWVLIIKIGLNFLILIWRILFVGKKINFPFISFLREVIIPIVIITAISSFVNVFIFYFFYDWSRLILSCIISSISTGSLVYFIGINAQERILLKKLIAKKIYNKG